MQPAPSRSKVKTKVPYPRRAAQSFRAVSTGRKRRSNNFPSKPRTTAPLEEIITDSPLSPTGAINGMAKASRRPVEITISMPAASAARKAARLRGLISGPVERVRVPSISIAISRMLTLPF